MSRQDELDLFDRAFGAWFLRAPVLPPVRSRSGAEVETRVGQAPTDRLRRREEEGEKEDETGDPLELGASAQELLRDKDFSELTGDELRRLRGADRADLPARVRNAHSRRRTADAHGDVLDIPHDPPVAARPAAIHSTGRSGTRKEVPRKLVVLCDVSGVDGQLRARASALPPRVSSARGAGWRRSPSGRDSRA